MLVTGRRNIKKCVFVFCGWLPIQTSDNEGLAYFRKLLSDRIRWKWSQVNGKPCVRHVRDII